MSSYQVVLLLGSNLGNKINNIEKAITEIENKAGKVTKKSKILKSEPVEFVSNRIFCNIALILETVLSPFVLLGVLKEIERDLGRLSDSKVLGKYEDRVIDIDIVCYSGIIFYSKKLEIPHEKHLYHRAFSREILDEVL
ncbi:MAG: 2-amino-4-hydroxy-6-hydroxymethyldihydropteridine diphosphokinase [Cloacibacterium sp.]|jgi:2-amino-4-hydroxy-6-hydroxymethyldihydropteridine diphosphokinase|nr:2-amino-4-hydroxy-6-hydroxymethyldihydropteridine diphosphokinase [Cloacibacterium sp.]